MNSVLSPMRRSMLVAALGFACQSAAHASPYTRVDTFGDSLSDAGHFAGFMGAQPRFTTNPDRVWVEHLAGAVGPRGGPSGINRAAGGARTTVQNGYPDPLLARFIAPVATQIDTHLAATPKLDRNGLYAVWSGANDVLHAVQARQPLLIDPATQREGALTVASDVRAAAGDFAALVNRLTRAGAGTVMVMNLPDLGQTPAARASQGQAIMSLASTQFNAALHDAMADAAGNIVMLDVHAMLNEIMATPTRYGLDNVTAPACTTESSQQCTRDTLVERDAHRRYLFADALHPSGAGHRLLSDYALSVLRAPAQMAHLADAPLAGLRLSARQVHDRLRPASEPGLYVKVDRDTIRARDADRDRPGAREGISAFTVGLDRRINERVLLGAALTHAQHRSTIDGGRGRFDLAQTLFSGYGQYRLGAWATSLTATAGQLDFGQIVRRFSIGPARLSERGHTDGTQFGLMAATRYDWTLGAVTLSPTFSLAASRTSVNTFTEAQGERRATGMRYLRQTRDSLVSSVGLDLTGTWTVATGQLTPYARIAYEHEHRAGARSVRARVQGMAGSFATPVRPVPRHTGVLTLGLQAQVARQAQASLAYHARFSDREQTQGVQAGLNVVF